MDTAALLRTGCLDQALAAVQSDVRERPQSVESRMMLFAMECVLGRFDKARNHLETAASLSQDWVLPAQHNRMLINAELARRDVFAGIRKPLILGEPPAWVAWYAEALALDAQGHAEQAWELRGKAWDASPGFSAAINDKQCEWISDADARLGPIFEAYLDGAYYWIPYTQLQRFESKAPEVLAEIVWLPIRLTLSTQAEIRGYSPVRYPGSENDPDSELRLARRTEWRDAPGGGSIALGQRLFDTDIGEFPLLECRSIDFSPNPGLPTPPSP